MLALFAALQLVAGGDPTPKPAAPPAGVAAPPQVAAFRIAAGVAPPKLDGRLDDAAWAGATVMTNFTQTEPDEGQPSRYPTVGRVLIDDDAIYVALEATDPDPSKIMAQLTRRDDDSPSDWLNVFIDSQHDKRTAYAFSVNPVGVKQDFTAVDNQFDASWDAVWDVATAITEQGWTAEFRIPLSALRFSSGGDGVWGLQLSRNMQRAKERSSWAPMKRDEPRPVATYGELHGLTGLTPPRHLEVLPYTVSRLTRAPGAEADPFYHQSDWQNRLGMDLKYGVTSNLTLDLTVNPDFGQVEADPSQVNLSAFETFLQEQRPFFTEGADIYRFGLALGDGGGANEQLFYSRRIGRAPQGRVSLSDGGYYVDSPAQTTILGAAKLSGRTASGWSVGALSALTGKQEAHIANSLGQSQDDQLVEPLTNYSMLRVRRDLDNGRTQVGGIVTSTVRKLDGTRLGAQLPGAAFTGGIDGSIRFGGDKWQATGYLLGSTVKGDSSAILRLQNSPARYYGRTDADYVTLDPSRNRLNGWMGNYTVSKVKGTWRVGLLGQARSPGFEVNDLGYERSADDITNVLYGGYRKFTPNKLTRTRSLNFNLWHNIDFGRRLTGIGGNVNGNVQFLNYWQAWGGVGHDFAALDTRALRGGPGIRRPGFTNAWIGFSTDSRKALSIEPDVNVGSEEESGGLSYDLSLYVTWRVSGRTNLTVAPSYGYNHSAWQYVQTSRYINDLGQPQATYVFGDLKQNTAALSFRLNHTFTPTTSFQLYTQPFASSGGYGGFREANLANPLAPHYTDRFRTLSANPLNGDYAVDAVPGGRPGFGIGNPDFNFRAVNVNAVLRWEYRPGSTLYAVWSHGRESYEPNPTFAPRHDFGSLFSEHGTNIFLIKLNWWLNV